MFISCAYFQFVYFYFVYFQLEASYFKKTPSPVTEIIKSFTRVCTQESAAHCHLPRIRAEELMLSEVKFLCNDLVWVADATRRIQITSEQSEFTLNKSMPNFDLEYRKEGNEALSMLKKWLNFSTDNSPSIMTAKLATWGKAWLNSKYIQKLKSAWSHFHLLQLTKHKAHSCYCLG